MKAAFALIGLGVMGKSLSLNLANKGVKLALYNRFQAGIEEDIAESFIQEHPILSEAQGFQDLSAFMDSIERPRKIFLMLPAGEASQSVLEALLPYLERGDILIDGGNAHYKDTERRLAQFREKGVGFLGTGISGGEKGALEGPSIMLGGEEQDYLKIRPFLEVIAARDKNGTPCCARVGRGGAGHFVKMVHNGIEYAEMQLLAELYQFLRLGYGMNPSQIAEELEWALAGEHSSYLLEITLSILKKKEGEHWLLDLVLDKASNKGTGSWSSIAAAELGVPTSMINAALNARYTSGQKETRMKAQKLYAPPQRRLDQAFSRSGIGKAYKIARLINHHQGIDLLKAASEKYAWGLDLAEIARIWTNGCIIRSDLMESLVELLQRHSEILLDEKLRAFIQTENQELFRVLQMGIKARLSLPCFSAAGQYLIAYTQGDSSANLIQAQRDYFGAHQYQRKDEDSGKRYHTNWEE